MSVAQLAVHQDVQALYRDHHGWLQGWLRRRLGNAFDAADLAQDAFLRLILKPVPKGFDSDAEARAYLRAMAQGMCVDLFRRRQVEQAWVEALAAQPEPCEPSPEYRAIVIETLMEIGALISRLPDKARNAFVLAQIHGLSTREIAGELGVSDRMVQKYLAQAMLQLALIDAGITR
ncbi:MULTISPECIES: sigma-70 family RNA polymerase sigma factor [Burkholderia]|uniref:RNA polymerase subunit sigma n=1 Tax=Burkholderia mayonis TaxID=1385591 RepID=A0A1B4FJD5_9BURK|nr:MULTISPECIES: sigma-70 family RNA polymerase sigma factor [Burkholderia]AOJ03722.1 RNA polymerase subunit sigma [Burkholderia mayonis]KVE41561.1 RNA polymerase subunit sigma [Burkholderia sp. BDU5]KVE46890.1 RNA polymerase subunit sigma [Burkholderia mayonis]